MRDGAFDYITKDVDTEDRLPGSVRIAAARAYARRASEAHQTVAQDDDRPTLPTNLIADSEAMRQTIRRIQRLANIDSPILITGEPGVGKRAMASVVHVNSRYASGPYVVVDCSTLSPNLIELWGEASRAGSGYCAQAEGGTLVLEQIHDLPMSQQRQVADFLRERRYRPVGAHSDAPCHVRVVATTTADLERLVRIGRFWRALYNELVIATLDVPPLRERRDKDDIPAIAGHLLRRYGLAEGIDPTAARILAAYDYPQGNIKELEGILRQAAELARGGEILPEHLPVQLQPATEPESTASSGTAGVDDGTVQIELRFVNTSPVRVIWASRTLGSTQSLFAHPFPGSDLALIQKVLEACQYQDNREARFSEHEFQRLRKIKLCDTDRLPKDIEKRIGNRLYQALMADAEAKSALDTVRRRAAEERRQLSLVLRFPPDTPELAGLPWELLWHDQHPLLFTRSKFASSIRYLDIPQALPLPLPLNQQLRLLIISPQRGVSGSLHAQERELRMQALQPLVDEGLLTIEEFRPATISALSQRLIEGDRVDVLHFYGHGEWRNGSGYLLLDDGELNASQCATLIGEIPLVVLYACHSGDTGSSSIFTGIAPMLSAEGVPTVIAMQYSVLIAAANCFHGFLYRSLAKGKSVQEAVANARQALYAQYPSSWYVPVLYIRAHEIGSVILVRR